CIAPHCSPETRHIPGHLGAAFQSHVARKRCDISSNLCALIDHNIAVNGQNVSAYLAAYVNRTVEACHVAHALVRLNSYIATCLKSIPVGISLGKHSRRAEQHQCKCHVTEHGHTRLSHVSKTFIS